MRNISAWVGLYLHHHGRRWLLMSVASSLLLLSFNARSQVISAKESSKTSPEVIGKARSGIAQDLFVEIEVKEIEQRQRQKREAQGLKHNDRKIVDEASQEMAAIKSKVLPGGKLEDAQVIEDFSYLPHLIVRVHSLKGLARLLQHPQVKSVQEERPFRPALSESLPLIGQPRSRSPGSGLEFILFRTNWWN